VPVKAGRAGFSNSSWTRLGSSQTGYSRKVRAVPVWLKKQAYAQYDTTSWEPEDYEIDHGSLCRLAARTRSETFGRDRLYLSKSLTTRVLCITLFSDASAYFVSFSLAPPYSCRLAATCPEETDRRNGELKIDDAPKKGLGCPFHPQSCRYWLNRNGAG